MTLLDLEDFVTEHRPARPADRDDWRADAKGYRLEVACSCGVTFERWVTPREAAEDLAILARLN